MKIFKSIIVITFFIYTFSNTLKAHDGRHPEGVEEQTDTSTYDSEANVSTPRSYENQNGYQNETENNLGRERTPSTNNGSGRDFGSFKE